MGVGASCSPSRVRGGSEQSIDEAWENLGYAIVEDCCQQWLECAITIKKLEVRRAWKPLTKGQETVLAHAVGDKRLCEEYLNSDICYDICGYTGKELIENLKERVHDRGYR